MLAIRFAFIAILVAAAANAATAATQPQAMIDITKVTCGDLVKAQPLDRAAVVMFYWGYEAAKENVTTFKTGSLRSATEKMIAYCKANASQTMFAAIKSLGARPF